MLGLQLWDELLGARLHDAVIVFDDEAHLAAFGVKKAVISLSGVLIAKADF